MRDHVATIRMNRPERSNALDATALDDLAAAWRSCQQDEQVRVVILTGAGERAFCAGADLKAFAHDEERARVGNSHEAFFPERTLLKPLIAAVNGACIAGGCELLLACDIRLAAPHAVFALPEPTLGMFPAGGSAARAPRRLAWPHAMRLLLTGEQVDATQALVMGLIGEVVEAADLLARANDLARKIAAASPAAVQAIKASALRTDGMRLLDALAAQQAYAEQVHDTGASAEGLTAFREKRDPSF